MYIYPLDIFLLGAPQNAVFKGERKDLMTSICPNIYAD